jgi:C4-dicarboxylate transporter, DctQ subunit
MTEDRAPAPPDAGRTLSAVDRGWAAIEDRLNYVAGLCVFALMLFVVVEVLSRRLLNAPIPGHIDFVEVGMITFAVLGVAYCQRLGGHVRMELLLSRLRGRRLWAIETLGTAVAAFVIGILVKTSWDHFWRAWTIGDSTMDIQLQTWPSKLLVPIALAILWVRLVIQLWGFLRLVRQPAAPPVAVPVRLTPEDIARLEAEQARRAAAGGEG